MVTMKHTHTHTHPFNGPFSGTAQVSRYQKGKTNLDFTGTGSPGWLGSRVVSVLDSGSEGPGFKSQSRRCRLTHTHTHTPV